eukprot:3662726-Rhodomonas_salina.3
MQALELPDCDRKRHLFSPTKVPLHILSRRNFLRVHNYQLCPTPRPQSTLTISSFRRLFANAVSCRCHTIRSLPSTLFLASITNSLPQKQGARARRKRTLGEEDGCCGQAMARASESSSTRASLHVGHITISFGHHDTALVSHVTAS